MSRASTPPARAGGSAAAAGIAMNSRLGVFSAYAAGLITVAWLVPIVAGFATMGSRLGWMVPELDRWSPIGVGLVAAALFWVIAGCLALPLALPRHVNARSWSAIQVRTAELEARVGSSLSDRAERPEEVQLHLIYLQRQLAYSWPAIRWASRGAFIDCWDRIHRAEEAFIATAPEAELRTVAHDARLRLQGALGISPQLSTLLDDTIRWLIRGCRRGPVRRWLTRAQAVLVAGDSPRSCQAPPGVQPAVANLDDARSRLRQVVSAINASRARNWAGLIHLRNQSLTALLITESFGYGLLALAIANQAEKPALVAGVLYFLVGATVGLLNHIIQLRRSHIAVDDYGLERIRLTLLPALSGLTGVAGVLLVAILSSPGLTSVLQPNAQSTAPIGHFLPALSEVFSLDGNRAALVFAALFGIAPGLLVARLGDLAVTYEQAIRSTQPAVFDLSAREPV